MLSLQTDTSIYNLACVSLSIVKRVYNGQALKLKCICSETNSFDKHYNDLERFLMERGCSSMLVEKEILWARKIPRNDLLDKEKSQGNDSKLTFNVMYYPVFRHLKPQLKELLVILACDEDHKKVFPEVPIIGFKNSKNLNSHLVRAALSDITEIGRCEICGGKSINMKNYNYKHEKYKYF